MFNCDFCQQSFTRRFNLARHVRSKHNTLRNNDDNKIINKDDDGIAIIANDNDLRDVDSKDLNSDCSETDNTIKEDNGNNELVCSENRNYLRHSDQTILSGVEAIKSKFKPLINEENDVQDSETKNVIRNTFVKVIPENNNTSILQTKLPELLQTALDILMIKELQDTDIRNYNRRLEPLHNSINIGENESKLSFPNNVAAKRESSHDSLNGGENKSELTISENVPAKHFKYGNAEQSGNDDHSNVYLECAVRKYWHDPNTVIDELRELMSSSKVGQQIFSIMGALKESSSTKYSRDRDVLIQALNLLKKSCVGQQVFSIIHELEKAEIIKPSGYVVNEEEPISGKEVFSVTKEQLGSDEE